MTHQKPFFSPNANWQALVEFSRLGLFLYVAAGSYVVAGYSIISAILAFGFYLGWLSLRNGDDVKRKWLRRLALTACLFFLWKPYPVEVSSLRWLPERPRMARSENDVLKVVYYEPNAFRTRITLEANEAKKRVTVRVWASYFPLDILMIDHEKAVLPRQREVHYDYVVDNQNEGETNR